MNFDFPVSNARCIEVVANVLPPWHGAQPALDATLRSARLCEPASGSWALTPALAWPSKPQAAPNLPELANARRARFFVIGVEGGGRFGADFEMTVCSVSLKTLMGSFLKLPPSPVTLRDTVRSASRLPMPFGTPDSARKGARKQDKLELYSSSRRSSGQPQK